MARPHTAKTFQQRQTERHQRELEAAKDRAIVEDMAAQYSSSYGVAHDFAGQCQERLVDVDFDLLCSDLALSFWADSPPPALPVVDLLRELAAERRRYRDAIADFRERLLALTKGDTAHHHLPQPVEYYEARVRDRMFPNLELRPVHNRAPSGDR
jgi:hypothetical protein